MTEHNKITKSCLVDLSFSPDDLDYYNKRANLTGGYLSTEYENVADFFLAAISHELDIRGKGPLDQGQCEITSYISRFRNPTSGKPETEHHLCFDFQGAAVEQILDLSAQGANPEWFQPVLSNYIVFLEARVTAGAFFYTPLRSLRQ